MRIYEEDLLPIIQEFPEITHKEASVIYLRRDNYSYGSIQKWMGNPSKKWIRQTLLKWAPELIDIKSY